VLIGEFHVTKANKYKHMKKFSTNFFFLIMCVLLHLVANGQVKFMVTASPQKAAKNEYITLKLTVENGNTINSIDPPVLKNFKIVGGPSQESSTSVVNGVVNKSFSFSYILQAYQPGNFVIGSASATVDGKTYRSSPINVFVSNKSIDNNQQQSNAAQSPFAGLDIFERPSRREEFNDYILRNGENVQEKVNKNMQLKLQTNKNACFVGQPILAAYKLYTRLQSESNLSKNPSFSGFSVVDMLDRSLPENYTQEKMDGRLYNVYTIRKAQLYPLQSGDIELDLATLDNKVSFVKYENGSGANGNVFTENVSLSSKPATIHVLPLPENNKPENFEGAVGNFSIDAQVEKNSFSTDETGKLIVTITGSGNMQLLTVPEIKWSPSFEAFEAKVTDNTNQTTIPISGSKTFEIPFTTANVGLQSIPSIGFSFFNPESKSYKTVFTKEIKITITKGTGIAKKQVPIAAAPKNEQMLSNKLLSRKILISLLLLAIMIIGFFFIRQKNKPKEEKIILEEKTNSVLEPQELQKVILSSDKNYLAKTQDCLINQSCEDFYRLLNDELKSFLSLKYTIDKNTIQGDTLSAVLDAKHVDNSLVLDTQKLMKNIEWQLYTPFERNELLQNMYGNAQTIIQRHIMQKI
jgi:hypothetical protein